MRCGTLSKDSAMRRRDTFRLATAAVMLAAPRIARAQRQRTLKFIPISPLTLLDPVFTGNRATHNHAYMVFDTLYGLDETLTARPQMVEGHTVDNDGDGLDAAAARRLAISRRHAGARARRGGERRRLPRRDPFGQALIAATGESVRARRSHAATSASSNLSPSAARALDRLLDHGTGDHAGTAGANRPVRAGPEMVGSGPYRFIARPNSARGSTQRTSDSAAMCPGGEGTPSYSAGPKMSTFDRVEWHGLDDPQHRSLLC